MYSGILWDNRTLGDEVLWCCTQRQQQNRVGSWGRRHVQGKRIHLYLPQRQLHGWREAIQLTGWWLAPSGGNRWKSQV